MMKGATRMDEIDTANFQTYKQNKSKIPYKLNEWREVHNQT